MSCWVASHVVEPAVRHWIPVFRELLTAEETNLAALGVEDPGLDESRDARVHRLTEKFGLAEIAVGNPMLLEPLQTPTRSRVELALLFCQELASGFD